MDLTAASPPVPLSAGKEPQYLQFHTVVKEIQLHYLAIFDHGTMEHYYFETLHGFVTNTGWGH